MTNSTILLKDKNGKTLTLSRMAFYLQVSENSLLNAIYGKGGYSFRQAMFFRLILYEKGYDFPATMFLSKKNFLILQKIVESETECKITKYNPLIQK